MKIYKNAFEVLDTFESHLGYNKTHHEQGMKNKTLSSLKKCFQLMGKRGNIKLTIDKKYDLKDLFIDGFDQEQIWQQIELRNRYLSTYVPVITDFLLNKNEVRFPCLMEKTEDVRDEGGTEKPDANHVADENFSDDESDDNESGGDGNEDSDSGGDSYSGSEEDLPSIVKNGPSKEVPITHEKDDLVEKVPKKRVRSKAIRDRNNVRDSVVDDNFFKISEMGHFLDAVENNKMEDNEIDYFDDMPSDSDEKEKNAKYDDFFRNPGSGDEDDEDIDGQGNVNNEEYNSSADEEIDYGISKTDRGPGKKVKFLVDDKSDESSSDEKTNFQIRESKLRQKIENLEKKNLSEKPWQHKGEVGVSDRPINSLLEEVVDVDLSVRPAPVITENVTNTLEQIILNRIRDSAYDDVERKIKPVHVPHELKKQLVLNQEKSKHSLAEIYEQEFLKRKPNNEENEEPDKRDPEKEKILQSMKIVFHKLDTLSNFHYTPKPASADIEIISNMPAITMEEVTPVAMSDANLLAPQEVGDVAKRKLLGKEERTKTDKLRERRKKKAFLSRKFKKESNTESAKISKVLKSKRVNLMKPNQDQNLKSSTSFFKKLQENSEVGKTAVKTKKKK